MGNDRIFFPKDNTLVPVLCSFCRKLLSCTKKEIDDIYCENCNEASSCYLQNNPSKLGCMDASHGICENCLRANKSEDYNLPEVNFSRHASIDSAAAKQLAITTENEALLLATKNALREVISKLNKEEDDIEKERREFCRHEQERTRIRIATMTIWQNIAE
jgi:hypothetical protein